MTLNDFPSKMWRGDGTELYFGHVYYHENDTWCTGYFDPEYDAWVGKITVFHKSQAESIEGLRTVLAMDEIKSKYFNKKPVRNLNYAYQKDLI